jgi:hypothetical protein
VDALWDRDASRFALFFEQGVMSLFREMSINAVPRHVEVEDEGLWRIVQHYVSKAIWLDEAVSKRGHD